MWRIEEPPRYWGVTRGSGRDTLTNERPELWRSDQSETGIFASPTSLMWPMGSGDRGHREEVLRSDLWGHTPNWHESLVTCHEYRVTPSRLKYLIQPWEKINCCNSRVLFYLHRTEILTTARFIFAWFGVKMWELGSEGRLCGDGTVGSYKLRYKFLGNYQFVTSPLQVSSCLG